MTKKEFKQFHKVFLKDIKVSLKRIASDADAFLNMLFDNIKHNLDKETKSVKTRVKVRKEKKVKRSKATGGRSKKI